MPLIVQKFGGTSVGNPERISRVAARVKRHHDAGDRLVVIVSAMSGETDRLIRLAREVSPEPTEREMDVLLATGEQTTIALLAMALHQLGVPAESFTGAQAGIVTDGRHTKARIVNITPRKLHASLDAGHVVIVAGFQGQDPEGDITTLGRGGSDLSAIALAAAVKADLCQIYTDVDGVYTTDPRIEPAARKIQELSYDEMLEMASLGSKVMQSRSVEFAKKFGVVFEVRSSLNDNPGTLVKEETSSMERVVVRGVSLEKNQARVSLRGLPDRPGIAARVFAAIGAANVNVDMIVQNAGVGEIANLSFTLNRDELPKASRALAPLTQEWPGTELIVQEGYAKVSVVGIGMRSHPGVAAQMFDALSAAGANIVMIATSEIKISVLIDEGPAAEAVKAVHAKFDLAA
jgi:aspartate kinase